MLCAVFAYSVFASLKQKLSQPDYSDEKIEILENAIIIDGLEADTDDEPTVKLPEKENSVSETIGQIYYLNDFEVNEKNIKSEIPDKDLIENLQKKDKRWHYSVYNIKRGDNLWLIAEKFDIDHILIIKANKIKNPDMLHPGKKIFVPNRKGIVYIVKKGDTLSEICYKHNISLESAVKHNGIKAHKIYPDMEIFLPDAYIPKPQLVNKKSKKSIIVKKENKSESSNNKNDNVHVAKNTIPFQWPLKSRITSSFGMRTHPITKKRSFHCGIDIGAVTGTPIKASYTGKVIYSGWKGGYGNMIVIEHKNKYITVYAHLSKLLKKKGDYVKTGDVIALSGATGTVTGPHLHFEIRKYLTPLNPLMILEK